MDDRVAWAHITLPPRVLTGGETVDDWFPLNGKMGDGQEGSINLVLSFNVRQHLYKTSFNISCCAICSE